MVSEVFRNFQRPAKMTGQRTKTTREGKEVPEGLNEVKWPRGIPPLQQARHAHTTRRVQ